MPDTLKEWVEHFWEKDLDRFADLTNWEMYDILSSIRDEIDKLRYDEE